MAIRNLRVYTGPDIDRPATVDFAAAAAGAARVRVTLAEILPILADAAASDRTWLRDFADDEIEISADLHDVLDAYRSFRRPGA